MTLDMKITTLIIPTTLKENAKFTPLNDENTKFTPPDVFTTENRCEVAKLYIIAVDISCDIKLYLFIDIYKLVTRRRDLGPVVQSIVSRTTSLRRQLVKYMPTKLSNTLLFFVGKM